MRSWEKGRAKIVKLSLFILKYVLVSMVDSLPGNGDRQRITSPEFYHHGQYDLHRDDHHHPHHHNYHHGNHHPRPRHGLCGSHNPGIAHSSTSAGNAAVFLHKVKGLGEGLQNQTEMDLYRAIPAVTKDFCFCSLIQWTVLFCRLVQ